MKFKVFTIFDVKAEAYLPPFFMHAKGLAERAFINMAKDPSNQIGLNPEDYTLFEIAEFDDSNATLVMLPAKVPLLTGIEAISMETPKHALSDVDLRQGSNGSDSKGTV